MQMHNGALELDTDAAQGATFRFVFPTAAPDEALPVAEAPASPAVGEAANSAQPVIPPPH
jgi:hypothetical protein